MTDTPKPITTPVAKLQGFGPSETEQINAELLEAAWDLIEELMGQPNWTVSDQDQSEWAVKSRRFARAADAARAAIARAEAR
jgi:hypothetical protein